MSYFYWQEVHLSTSIIPIHFPSHAASRPIISGAHHRSLCQNWPTLIKVIVTMCRRLQSGYLLVADACLLLSTAMRHEPYFDHLCKLPLKCNNPGSDLFHRHTPHRHTPVSLVFGERVGHSSSFLETPKGRDALRFTVEETDGLPG